MPELTSLIQQGMTGANLLVPSAIALGALHGFEPGHSKTMMAAFIVAIRGTVAQAALLGLAATLSHTAVVWAVVLLGMHFGQRWSAATSEPYLQLASALLMASIATWMIWRTHRQRHSHHEHNHEHAHEHDHAHTEDSAAEDSALVLVSTGHTDAHTRAHADDIRRRFTTRDVTTGQIVAFGITGGLVPCPASITVLLLCLQLKKIALGTLLVASFSVGLALTLVASGILAAVGMRHMSEHWSGFGAVVRYAPYLSGGLILIIGLYVGSLGLRALI